MSRFNLRKRARVCYHEPEEPPFDEYVFCTECRDYVYEYCSIHGPMLVIPDDKVGARTGFPAFVPRAALTIPRVFLHLAYSRIPGAGLGVFSTLSLPAGVRFGPYRGQRVQTIGDSNYGWQIYDRSHKPLHIVDARDPNNSNWMRYVNCSRHHVEQNLVAYQYQGQLYYRTVKEVPRFAELLVFYGSEFASRLGVDLRAYRGPCVCPKCQARHLAAKKTEPSKTNKRKAPVEEKKEKFNEKLHKKNSAKINPGTSAASQDLSSSTDVTPEKPAGNSSSSEVNTLTAETNFKCKKCGKGFNIKSDLEKHLNTHMLMEASTSHKVSKFACKTCNSIFDTKLLLQEHEKSRHGVKYFACDKCEYATKHARSLQTHLRTHTDEKPFRCSQCKSAFTTNGSLQTHLRSHTGEKPFRCSQCKSAFAESGHLQTHLRTHTGEKPFRCSQCKSAFAQSGNLQKHLRTHTGEKPFRCSQCKSAFAESGHLQTHLRTHTGEKPFRCSQCKSAFAQSGHLQNHLRTHTGEKPFRCSQCKSAFTTSCNLQTHLRTHTGEKPFECNICDYKTTQSGPLKSHLMSRHSGQKPFSCDACSYRGATKGLLRHHTKKHHKSA